MADTLEQICKDSFRTNLDEEIVALPGRSLRSVVGLFAHLENLASRCKSGPSTVSKGRRGTRSSLPSKAQPEAVSFRELGRQVIRVARLEVEVLQNRLHKIQSLVLINDWAVAERLWREFLPGCKTPLFELNFLEELWAIEPATLVPETCPLTRFWHQFVLIQAEIETLITRRRSLVELSDALERELGHWLRRFADILEKLDEASA